MGSSELKLGLPLSPCLQRRDTATVCYFAGSERRRRRWAGGHTAAQGRTLTKHSDSAVQRYGILVVILTVGNDVGIDMRSISTPSSLLLYCRLGEWTAKLPFRFSGLGCESVSDRTARLLLAAFRLQTSLHDVFVHRRKLVSRPATSPRSFFHRHTCYISDADIVSGLASSLQVYLTCSPPPLQLHILSMHTQRHTTLEPIMMVGVAAWSSLCTSE